jgi:hypothetical protein
MARPKRMGAYNALDDLLPGPPSAKRRLEPVPDLPEPRTDAVRLARVNALDELLPGPGPDRDRTEGTAGERPARPRLKAVAGAAWAPRRGEQHLEAWNPLDDLTPPEPVKARVTVRLPADLVEAARDAVAHLNRTPDRTTLSALAERGLRAELARLEAAHNHHHPFPPRPGRN